MATTMTRKINSPIPHAELAGLVDACIEGDMTAIPAVLDWLSERPEFDRLHEAKAYLTSHRFGRKDAYGARYFGEAVKEHFTALILHPAIISVDPTRVPVQSTDRHIFRKDQAKLTRSLFTRLGLKGISVTTPSYSMASSVDVKIPWRSDIVTRDQDGYAGNDEAVRANRYVLDHVSRILAYAFPNHNDRSDSSSDHFDFCWSIR